jgi:hypothetical protein
MWNWLWGNDWTSHEPLSEREQALVAAFLQGESPYGRALRAQVPVLARSVTATRTARSLYVRFANANHPHLWLPDISPLNGQWQLHLPWGRAQAYMRIIGAVDEMRIETDFDLTDDRLAGLTESAAAASAIQPLVRFDEAVVHQWDQIFGEYLHRTLTISGGPNVPDELRYLIPAPPASSSKIQLGARALYGRAVEDFRMMIQVANGINFFGVHLGVEGRSSWTDDVVIVSNLINSNQSLRCISLMSSNEVGSAFYEGPYDRKPSVYAESLMDLFRRLYADIGSRRLFGSA